MAESLLVHEGTTGNAVDDTSAAARLSEKLRRRLAASFGSSGFRALLGRALILAQAETPGLGAVEVDASGVLTGLDELKRRSTEGASTKSEVVLFAHLLGLLVTFIGEDLMQRLVRDVLPLDFHDEPTDEKPRPKRKKP